VEGTGKLVAKLVARHGGAGDTVVHSNSVIFSSHLCSHPHRTERRILNRIDEPRLQTLIVDRGNQELFDQMENSTASYARSSPGTS
jgi:hypothetical protein